MCMSTLMDRQTRIRDLKLKFATYSLFDGDGFR